MQNIKISLIERNILNPRKNFDSAKLRELADSIREVGIIEPLVVSAYMPGYDTSEEYRFRIIAGERRWRAATMAGLDEVPCIVKFDMTAEQEIRLAIIENLQRQDLDPIEEAGAYRLLLETKDYTQESLAKELGVSQAHIANRIRLLDLPEEIQENISREIISPSHGRVLAGYKELPQTILKKAAQVIAEENVPVAKAAERVSKVIAAEGLPLFDHWQNKPEFKVSECKDCNSRVMGLYPYSDDEKPYCLKKSCWEEKQEAIRLKRIEKAEKAAAGKEIIDLGKLNYSDYEIWTEGSTSYDQTDCAECEKRKLAKRQSETIDQARLICTDLSCMRKKKTAMTREKNKDARDAFQVELEKIAGLAKEIADICATFDIERPVLIYLAAQVLANITHNYDRKMTRYQFVKDKFGWTDEFFKNGAYQSLNNDWDIFRSRLETLSEQQLWEIIFEWPAVAEGLKGIRSWILEQELAAEPEDDLPKLCNCGWPGHSSLDGTADKESETPAPVDEDPVYALMGRTIKTHYNTGGVVTYVNGPKQYGFYTINYKRNPGDKKFGILNNITVSNKGVVLCGGNPLIIEPEEETEPHIECDLDKFLADQDTAEDTIDAEPASQAPRQRKSYANSSKEIPLPTFAKRAGLPAAKVRKMAEKGEIKSRESYKHRLIPESELEKVLLAAEVEPPCENVKDILETDDVLPVWGDLVNELTDEELLDAIRREHRPSAKSKLRKEARRRELDTKGVA